VQGHRSISNPGLFIGLGKNNGIIPVAYREITLPWQEKYPLAPGYYPACSHNMNHIFGFPGCGTLIDQSPDSFDQSPHSLIYS